MDYYGNHFGQREKETMGEHTGMSRYRQYWMMANRIARFRALYRDPTTKRHVSRRHYTYYF